MSVRSGQAVVTVFTTSASSGASADADALPTATLYVNGVANAAVVTVANISTGLYKASVTLPALALSDHVAIVVSATVGGVAGKGKVWEATKDFFAGSVPDATAGGAGGLPTADAAGAVPIPASQAAAVAAAASGNVTADHGAGSYVRNTEPVDVSADVSKVRAATYDSATRAGNVLTLSNGKTQTIDDNGRTTSP